MATRRRVTASAAAEAAESGTQGHTPEGAPALAHGMSSRDLQLPKRLSVSMERALHAPFGAWIFQRKGELPSEGLNMTRAINALVGIMLEDEALQSRVLERLAAEDAEKD